MSGSVSISPVVAEILIEIVLPVPDDADPVPLAEAVAWNNPPRNCCSAALMALAELVEVTDVEPVDEEADDEVADDVLPDDVTPICASAAAMAAPTGLVADASPVDVESESSGD